MWVKKSGLLTYINRLCKMGAFLVSSLTHKNYTAAKVADQKKTRAIDRYKWPVDW